MITLLLASAGRLILGGKKIFGTLLLLEDYHTGGQDHFPHSGEAKRPSPRQRCIIIALDKNIDNRRTARVENSPDLN